MESEDGTGGRRPLLGDVDCHPPIPFKLRQMALVICFCFYSLDKEAIEMSIEEMQRNVSMLVDKYLPERKDLIDLINRDPRCTKHVLAEIEKFKIKEYTDGDLDLIHDIAFYYL